MYGTVFSKRVGVGRAIVAASSLLAVALIAFFLAALISNRTQQHAQVHLYYQFKKQKKVRVFKVLIIKIGPPSLPTNLECHTYLVGVPALVERHEVKCLPTTAGAHQHLREGRASVAVIGEA